MDAAAARVGILLKFGPAHQSVVAILRLRCFLVVIPFTPLCSSSVGARCCVLWDRLALKSCEWPRLDHKSLYHVFPLPLVCSGIDKLKFAAASCSVWKPIPCPREEASALHQWCCSSQGVLVDPTFRRTPRLPTNCIILVLFFILVSVSFSIFLLLAKHGGSWMDPRLPWLALC